MEKTTLKSYNDLFKETDGNTAKFYVLYNTNLTYLLSSNEIVTFYQIVHVCNIGRNYASLNYLKNLLNMSLNTIKKSIEKLILLKLIERNKNYNSTFFYTLNLESIGYIYDNVNSCHKLEERKTFCKQYIEDCIKESTSVPESALSKFDTSISKFDRAISKIDTPAVSKNDTHISNMFIKEDEFNNENEFYNKDVEVGEQANAETLNDTANANSSFNVNSTNVGKELVSTDDVISKMFPELPIEDSSNEKSSKNDMNFETYFDRIKTAFNTDDITTLTEFEDMFSSKETFDNLSKEDINELKFYASDAKQRLQRKLIIDKPAGADNSNEMANADSNDGKSFNGELENDVVADSNGDDSFDEIFTYATSDEIDSNESTYKTENDMMRDEDKKAINEYKIAKKLLTNDERSAIMKHIFENLKTLPKEDAIKVLTDYKFSKKEIDFVKECYANQYSYAS